jgi:hypothetical protein
MSYDVETCWANAVAWAIARDGSTAYATRCLAFVEDAIERSNGLEMFGGDDAAESSRFYGAASNTGAPPPHSLVFYQSVGELYGERRDWGHVGLSVGNGAVVHAWDRVRVDDHRAIEALTPAPGWEQLRWVGWAPLTRALEGARPRVWRGEAASEAVRMQAERFGP